MKKVFFHNCLDETPLQPPNNDRIYRNLHTAMPFNCEFNFRFINYFKSYSFLNRYNRTEIIIRECFHFSVPLAEELFAGTLRD